MADFQAFGKYPNVRQAVYRSAKSERVQSGTFFKMPYVISFCPGAVLLLHIFSAPATTATSIVSARGSESPASALGVLFGVYSPIHICTCLSTSVFIVAQ